MSIKPTENISHAGAELNASDEALQRYLEKHASEHDDDKPAIDIEKPPAEEDFLEYEQDLEELEDEEEEAAEDAGASGA